MDNFLDILLEADKITVKSGTKSDTDYTEDASGPPPVADETPSDQQNDEGQDDDGTQDYTEETVTVDPQDDEDGGEGSNDYTDDGGDTGDNPDDTSDSGDANDEDSSDYTEGTGDETPNPSAEEEAPEDSGEALNNRQLLSDFIEFFYTNRNIVSKLSEVNRSDILINKVINQVKINLSELHKVLFDYITRQFSQQKYVKNLYKYNYFMEAFRINVQMLKKISVLSDNAKTNI